MKLFKEDLNKIGHTMYGGMDGKFLHILCNVETSNIEEILLRNILLLFGDYKITHIEECEMTDGHIDIEFATNLPWSECCAIF